MQHIRDVLSTWRPYPEWRDGLQLVVSVGLCSNSSISSSAEDRCSWSLPPCRWWHMQQTDALTSTTIITRLNERLTRLTSTGERCADDPSVRGQVNLKCAEWAKMLQSSEDIAQVWVFYIRFSETEIGVVHTSLLTTGVFRRSLELTTRKHVVGMLRSLDANAALRLEAAASFLLHERTLSAPSQALIASTFAAETRTVAKLPVASLSDRPADPEREPAELAEPADPLPPPATSAPPGGIDVTLDIDADPSPICR